MGGLRVDLLMHLGELEPWKSKKETTGTEGRNGVMMGMMMFPGGKGGDFDVIYLMLLHEPETCLFVLWIDYGISWVYIVLGLDPSAFAF